MPALNLAAFERDGLLPEADYNKVTRKLATALKGLRIQSIRKALDFEAHEYDDYELKAKESFDKHHMPVSDPEFAFDFNTTPLTFCATFPLSFFPDFNREYFRPNILDEMIVAYDEKGYSIIPIGQFRSLLLAGHQLRTAAKAAFDKTSIAKDLDVQSVEIETEFLLPTKLLVDDINDEMTIHLTFFLLFDE